MKCQFHLEGEFTMNEKTINFTNEHGSFELEVGLTYDLDLLYDDGNVEPFSNLEVVSEKEEIIKLKNDDDIYLIQKKLIVHTTEVEE